MRGITVGVVTQDPFQSRRPADRTGLMISSRVVQIADTEQFSSPSAWIRDLWLGRVAESVDTTGLLAGLVLHGLGEGTGGAL